MFLPFFETLRRTGVPVSLREYLAFLEGVAAGLVYVSSNHCASQDRGHAEHLLLIFFGLTLVFANRRTIRRNSGT